MLASLPASTTEPLQCVQNAAARLIFQLGLKDCVTQGLHQLHWLTISYCITFKLCVLTYAAHSGNSLLTLTILSAAGDNQCCIKDSVWLLRATTSNPDSVPSSEKELSHLLILMLEINFLLHCVRHLTSTPSRNNLKLTFLIQLLVNNHLLYFIYILLYELLWCAVGHFCKTWTRNSTTMKITMMICFYKFTLHITVFFFFSYACHQP